ncbi:DNA-binding response regulator [Cupriavidus sp. TKC]|uniref:response regulator transcription factor n=1 Tax=Cupriavidus TaxID=106589 RepID=UPI0002A1DA55|nr:MULTISPECIES: response regulator transcription factor [Cupriavidus]EKZ96408.1 LuxR family transcriptional regulator [Cupriavidus sp. HMR-1]GMG89955.1 DNA-binding response regulator [Cupriavidus sp. TKC]
MIRAVGSDFAPSKNCRIVIADDHPIVLIALSHFLNSHGFTVDAMVSTADETCAAILNPDVQLVITDYVFGHPGDGLHLVDRLRRLRSDIGILVYSMVTSAPVINDILLAGANAFVPKTEGTETLLRACQNVLKRTAAQGVNFSPLTATQDGGAFELLSVREREVMRLIAQGMSVREIGKHLRRSPKTVSVQKCSAMAKLGLRNDLALSHYLARRGWLE